MQKLHQLWQWLIYIIKGKSRYYIHSPFVFDFINQVLLDRRSFYVFNEIENLKLRLLQNKNTIDVTDFGAGHAGKILNKRSIQSIVKTASKSEKWSQLIFRIAKHYSANHILELGTSLGLTSLYLSGISNQQHVVTMEGCPNTAAMANTNFRQMKRNNIQLVVGNFDDHLVSALSDNSFDLIFIDGNHKYEPTLRYFDLIKQKIHHKSIIIFDDIHWSNEMTMVWNKIKSDKTVSVTIDLYQLGIIFFHPTQHKADFILYY